MERRSPSTQSSARYRDRRASAGCEDGDPSCWSCIGLIRKVVSTFRSDTEIAARPQDAGTVIYHVGVASDWSEKWFPLFGPMPRSPRVRRMRGRWSIMLELHRIGPKSGFHFSVRCN